jgi:hypothetical protein
MSPTRQFNFNFWSEVREERGELKEMMKGELGSWDNFSSFKFFNFVRQSQILPMKLIEYVV